ncbi:MAG: hypothetical protein HZC54_19985 [Verrucomicrobia bacterium]|nr:hypothetical protein [Verrucomicrobiota bacterium]
MPYNPNANQESLDFARLWIRLDTVLVAAAVVATAFKANYQDPVWVGSFVTASALAGAGIVVLYGERYSERENIFRRVCGEVVLWLGLIGLLALLFFPDWFSSV